LGIEIDSLLKELDAFLHSFDVSLVPVEAAIGIEAMRFKVLCIMSGQQFTLRAGQLWYKRLRRLFSQRVLQSEWIISRFVNDFVPQLLAIALEKWRIRTRIVAIPENLDPHPSLLRYLLLFSSQD
jgi:hypothetical protein